MAVWLGFNQFHSRRVVHKLKGVNVRPSKFRPCVITWTHKLPTYLDECPVDAFS
jgi:hypothetical protein